jgi:RHS repeat-associated protein
MSKSNLNRGAAMVVMLLSASAYALGPISFGGVPAVDGAPVVQGAAPATATGKTNAPLSASPALEQMPGVSRAILAPVTPDQSEAAIQSRTLPNVLNPGVAPKATAKSTSASVSTLSAARVAGDASPAAPASIPELARALRNNPDLIYEYVRNNIEYTPTWGVQKGALGTLLDNQGTAFDQASLMIALLRQSGYTASFVKGRLNLSAAQVSDWLGVDTTNICAVLNLLGNAQIPTSSVIATAAGSCPGSTAALYSLKVDHVWVKVNIGGSNYYFDPSYKGHTRKSGIDLVAATGYNAASYLTAAKTGATVTADYVQGINRSNIRNNLTSYASNLTSYLRTNKPAGVLDDVIGGMTITPYSGANLRQTALAYQDTTVALTEWATDIPANYKPTLRVQYQGIDATYTSDAIYGRRLSLTYNAANQPVLMLDGTVAATGTAVTPGTYGNVSFTVTHSAYAQTFANQAFTQQIKSGGTFVIGNGWGPAGRGPIELHRARLDQARASGVADTAELTLGSTLAILSASWITQVNQADYITDRLARTNTLFHHQIGIAGYNTAPYVDLPGNMVSVVSQDANTAKEAATFFSDAMHSSIMESTAVQQTSGVSAVSTVKLIDIAAAANDKIFDAKTANYTSVVLPSLVGCTSWLPSFQSAVSAGRRLILPARCNLNEGSWTGTGYYSILVGSSGSSIGSIIGGGLAGGFAEFAVSQNAFNTTAQVNTQSQSGVINYTLQTFNDPIDMTKGHFLYAHDDMVSGAGEFPYSLNFNRLYSSGLRTQDSPLGKGWTHSLAVSASLSTDGLQSMGEDSALDAAGTIAEALVSLDLMSDTTKPLDKMVVATLGQRWFGDQLMGNTVIVKQGLNGEVFTKLPDGSYNAPPGNNAKLTRNADTSYSYETANKVKLNFNTVGKIASYVHPSGVQVNFTYSGANLTQVSNSLGRSLTLTNTAGRVTAVSDGSRSVQYAFDASANLTTFTDATAKATTFQYDQPGRITKFFYPSNPTIAFASNVYDTLGRVQTQTNANGKLYTYYFAGSRSEEVGPLGLSRVSYVDSFGRVLKSINPLGKVTSNTYDGQTRLIKTVLPEGNSLEYDYDDAPCAAQSRCTHNTKTIRQIPKTGSGLTTLTRSFTYESAFNQVASATDAKAQVTNFTYTAQGLPLSVTSPADPAGVQPVTTYGYSAYSAAGFPAFYLPTSVTQKTSASNTVQTSTAFNASNKYVPQTVTVDAGTGKLNLATALTFDAVGNPTGIDGPRIDVVDTVANSFDAERRLSQSTNALGKLSRNAFDADGRLIRSAAQVGTQWLVTCRSYSPSGKLIKAWGPALTAADTTCPTAAAPVSVTDITYDDLDRPVRSTQNLTVAEGGARLTDTVYNLDDSVNNVQRAVGSAVAQTYATYSYTNNGLVASLKDAKNNLTSYQYDGHDRKIKALYPNPTTVNTSSSTDFEQYGFDANSNLTSLRKRNGQSITLAYDNLNRLTSRVYPSTADNVSYGYDLLGRRLSSTGASAADNVAYVYDNAGRLTSTTANGKTLSYQVDAAGNRVRTSWPEATPFYVTTSFDALNRPTAIKELGVTSLASYAYDDLSRRSTVTLGNATTTTYGYDTQAALSSLAHNLTGTAQDTTYGYSRNQAREITSHTWSNDVYQWAGVLGNATNGTRSYSANGLNEYTAAAGATLTYDANANLTGDGSWTYGYDLNNRLKTAAKAGTSATLAYDSEGRLRQSVITAGSTATSNLLYDGTDLVAEYDAANVLQRRYVHGPGVDEPLVVYEGATTTAKSWLYADHLGSIVGTANAAGTSTAIYSYGPYGEPNIATGQRFRYTGQQLISGLGLYYYKARFYSPALGRFLQTDPIGYADDLNLYAYVGGNPVNFSDPSGLVANWAKGITLTDVPGVGWLSPSQGASSAQHWSDLRAETGNQLYAVPQGIATLWAEHSDEMFMVLSSIRGGAGAKSSTSLYQKLGPNGEHLKYGIANNPSTRYTNEELGGGSLKILAEGPRQDMLKLERGLHETLPIGSQEGQKFYIQKQIDKGFVPPPYKP